MIRTKAPTPHMKRWNCREPRGGGGRVLNLANMLRKQEVLNKHLFNKQTEKSSTWGHKQCNAASWPSHNKSLSVHHYFCWTKLPTQWNRMELPGQGPEQPEAPGQSSTAVSYNHRALSKYYPFPRAPWWEKQKKALHCDSSLKRAVTRRSVTRPAVARGDSNRTHQVTTGKVAPGWQLWKQSVRSITRELSSHWQCYFTESTFFFLKKGMICEGKKKR